MPYYPPASTASSSDADPIQQSYAPSSFTLTTGKYALLYKTLTLTSTNSATAQGTATIRIIT